ncbi:MAG: four helix bundle protein [Patescibacteria group bacterium]
MEDAAGYKKLIVWQKADELVVAIYHLTQLFPRSEIFALTSQIRRAAISVATNIVEGYARNSKSEFRRFIVISLGSLAEVKYLLSIAYRLRYMTEKKYHEIMELAEITGQLLWKFYRSLMTS